MPEIESINWGSPIFYIGVLLLGCCVGSYLNAVIYRLPRGLSTSDPKRSFCPFCKKSIPFYRNLPIITWLLQRGKCAECEAPIAVRYLLVELLTGLIWVGLWWYFADYASEIGRWVDPDVLWHPPALAGFFIILATFCIVISFVDIEHLLIPMSMVLAGSVVSLIAALFLPHHLGEFTMLDGLIKSLIGGVTGLLTLYLVVRLGKWLFGKVKIESEKRMDWHVRDAKENADDPNENVCLVLDGEENFWHDILFRKTDKLIMQDVSGLELNGEKVDSKEVIFMQERVILEDRTLSLENLKSISGTVSKLTIPREAMGMGDVYLLGFIGMALGYHSLLFVIVSACLIGIVLHVVVGAGLGKRLPFGPSLILGGLAWAIYGPEVVALYSDWVAEFVGASVTSSKF